MSDFVVNGALFYKAQQNLGSALSLFENNRSNITKCKDTISNTYEYKKKVSEVCNNLLFLINDVSLLNRNISDAKERLISLNPGFAAEYYDAASKKYDNLHGRLTQEEKNITQYNQEQYQRNLCKYLENLEAQGLMTDELRKVYEQVKLSVYVSSLSHELEKMDPNSAEYRQSRKWYDSNCQKLLNLQIKELESKGNLSEAEQKQLDDLKYAVKAIDLEKMQLELEEMNRNPVKNPDTPGNGRIPYDQIEAYRKECEKYGKYYQKKLKLEQDIEAMQRELGVYQNKWYEDFGEAATKTGAAWAKAFQSGNIDDFKSAYSQTDATWTVIKQSFANGVFKFGEHFVDLGVLGYDSIRSVGSYLQGDEESAKKIMDDSLDFVRRDLVGEANKNYYENNPYGKRINEISNLKYDSAGAKAIQNAGEFTTKVVAATAATVATGGAGAVVIGAFYGGGKAAEDYAQSVDRKHGESYNYTEAALRITAGEISGAAEFYGYGQIGAGALGVKIPSNASTSFAKNFFTKDTLLDTASVVSDHVVNAICGDETWQEALLYGGAETVLAIGLNAIGARQATKAARAAEAAEDAARAVKQLDESIEILENVDVSKTQVKINNIENSVDNVSFVSKKEKDLIDDLYVGTVKKKSKEDVLNDLFENAKKKTSGDLGDLEESIELVGKNVTYKVEEEYIDKAFTYDIYNQKKQKYAVDNGIKVTEIDKKTNDNLWNESRIEARKCFDSNIDYHTEQVDAIVKDRLKVVDENLDYHLTTELGYYDALDYYDDYATGSNRLLSKEYKTKRAKSYSQNAKAGNNRYNSTYNNKKIGFVGKTSDGELLDDALKKLNVGESIEVKMGNIGEPKKTQYVSSASQYDEVSTKINTQIESGFGDKRAVDFIGDVTGLPSSEADRLVEISWEQPSDTLKFSHNYSHGANSQALTGGLPVAELPNGEKVKLYEGLVDSFSIENKDMLDLNMYINSRNINSGKIEAMGYFYEENGKTFMMRVK